MTAVWAYALYTPAGRVSDWYRTPTEVPWPWSHQGYIRREMETLRGYIGPMSEAEARHFFSLADATVRDYTAARMSLQAEWRDQVIWPRCLDEIADVAQVEPAE